MNTQTPRFLRTQVFKSCLMALPAGAVALFGFAFLAACSNQSDSSKAPSNAPTTAASGSSSSGAQAGNAAPTPGANSGAAGNGGPVSVTTVKAQQRDLPTLLQAAGSVTSLSTVDVRAQTTSVITKVHIQEGQFVKAGDLMFTLDSRNDEANLAKARAQLAKDQAALTDAQRQLQRSKELLEKNFVSSGAVDTNQTTVDSFTATVAADKAAIDAAQVALSFGRITAPQTGRVGAINVFAGSAVQANQTSLVTITQLDPIAVSFSLPQRYLPDALAALKQGSVGNVTATLPDSGIRFAGRLNFVDNAVDLASGTVKIKAVFANRDNKLWPGGYVDVSLKAQVLKDAVVVPQASIIQTSRGTIVYVVESGKAILRPIKLLQSQGDQAAISGVKVGESVVLDGRQNLRPNVAVNERPNTPAPDRANVDKGADKGADRGTDRGTERSAEKNSDATAARSPESGKKAAP